MRVELRPNFARSGKAEHDRSEVAMVSAVRFLERIMPFCLSIVVEAVHSFILLFYYKHTPAF